MPVFDEVLAVEICDEYVAPLVHALTIWCLKSRECILQHQTGIRVNINRAGAVIRNV